MGTAREITRRVIAISSMDMYRAWGTGSGGDAYFCRGFCWD
jgi:hypothetical protein